MRWRPRWRVGSALGYAILVWSLLGMRIVHAQQTSPDEYVLVPMLPGAMLSLWGSEPSAPGAYLFALSVQSSSLVPTAAGVSLSGSASSFGLLATLGVWQSVDVSAALSLQRVSVESASETEGTRHRAALGALGLSPRLRLWGSTSGSGVAVLLPVSIRTSASLYATAALRAEPRLAVTASGGPVHVTLNAGYVSHVSEANVGIGFRNFGRAGVGAELELVESWSVLSEVAGRWSPDDRGLTTAGGWSSEAHLAGRYRNSGWAVQVGAGTGILGAVLEPAWRMLASVSFSFAAPEPAGDAATATEQTSPRDLSGYSNEVSDWAGSAPAQGAPEQAAPPESAVKLPTNEAVTASPLASSTPAPAASGPLGSEAPTPIDEVLLFAPNQMRLDARQLALLDRVATQLLNAPPGVQLVVEGHCDTSGPGSFNSRLSRMRASTVRYHLLRKGIHWRRITIRAFGALRPAEAHATDDAGAQNRRVEFRWKIPD